MCDTLCMQVSMRVAGGGMRVAGGAYVNMCGWVGMCVAGGAFFWGGGVYALYVVCVCVFWEGGMLDVCRSASWGVWYKRSRHIQVHL